MLACGLLGECACVCARVSVYAMDVVGGGGGRRGGACLAEQVWPYGLVRIQFYACAVAHDACVCVCVCVYVRACVRVCVRVRVQPPNPSSPS
jgi:hypothetical protein